MKSPCSLVASLYGVNRCEQNYQLTSVRMFLLIIDWRWQGGEGITIIGLLGSRKLL